MSARLFYKLKIRCRSQRLSAYVWYRCDPQTTEPRKTVSRCRRGQRPPCGCMTRFGQNRCGWIEAGTSTASDYRCWWQRSPRHRCAGNLFAGARHPAAAPSARLSPRCNCFCRMDHRSGSTLRGLPWTGQTHFSHCPRQGEAGNQPQQHTARSSSHVCKPSFLICMLFFFRTGRSPAGD